MDYTSCPIVAGAPNVLKAAFTKEIDFFAQRGIKYLDPALLDDRAAPAAQAAVRGVPRAPGHHRGRVRLRLRRGLGGDAAAATSRWRPRAAPSSSRSRRRTASRSCMLGPPLPPGSGAEPQHPRGVPGARVSGAVDPVDPQGRGLPGALLRRGPQAGAHQDAARDRRRVAGELLVELGAEGVGGEVRGAPPERGGAGPVVVQVRPRRADLRDHRQHHLARRRRPTRRCTTSTPTSRAARSRSA